MDQILPFVAALVVATLAVCTDIKCRLVPNLLTFPAMALGLVLHSVTSGWDGLGFASLGLVAGLGLHLLPFLLGRMGAGDVKLLAALGAFLGPSLALWTALYAALFGGVWALVLIVRTLGWAPVYLALSGSWKALVTASAGVRGTAFPYAAALWLGVVAAYAMR
ncbi:MAG: prepilin peptidase [Chloroflexi bacterium]|nr:prepilin peptidase [Chloroflexota bacterium]